MNNLISTNPSKNYEPIGSVEVSTAEEVAQKVAAAHAAKKLWRDMDVAGRIKLIQKVMAHFDADREKLAQLMSQEMGMPIKESREDMQFGLDYLKAYCDQAENFFKPEISYKTESEIHEIYHEPYGVAAVIVPWNFPFTNFVWQCGQNLIAGNTVVFKHSEETPLCGKLIEEIVCAELPAGVFSEVYGDRTVGELLINQDVNLICFTGSTQTGIKINESAASRFIPTVLELGGSAPGIIFEDADSDAIINTVFSVRFANCGQMCDALKRLIVHERKLDEVVAKLTDLIQSKKVGDAQDEHTDIGPLVAQRQVDLLEAQMADALEKDAHIVVGGNHPNGLAGAYYEPTLLTDVTQDMRVWNEEVFGPVLPITPFATEEEAIALANNTCFGLGAYIFTQDTERFNRVAAQLESGMVAHNNVSYINVNNPFGGYKMSGNSREHTKFGFDEVTRLKVVSRQKTIST